MTPKAKRERSTAGSIIELVVIVIVAVGLAYGIQALLVKPYRIPSGSMEPTLAINQRVLVNRVSTDFTDPSVGDILVFHPPTGAKDNANVCGRPHPENQACAYPTPGQIDDTYIKRVVGLPGDRLSIVGGHVIRNGKRESDGYIAACSPDVDACNLPHPFVVPKGHYFMMGDNRGNSDDSRFWGPIPKDAIIGEAFATYWPPDRLGLL